MAVRGAGEERVKVTSCDCGGVLLVSVVSPSDRNDSGRFSLQTVQGLHESAATVLLGSPTQRVRRSRRQAGRIAYYDFSEAAINSSSVLNNKCRRESPAQIFQRIPNTARIHKNLFPPSLIIPFFLLREAG